MVREFQGDFTMSKNYNVQETKDYSIFSCHENNRNVNVHTKKFKQLLLSMRKYGFLPFCPIWVKKDENNKLSIQTGHHRLHAAMQLKIPVCYMIYNTPFKIWEEEKSTKIWNLADHFTRLIAAGDANALAIKNYHDETGITLSICLSLFSGGSTYKCNKIDDFKKGRLAISPNAIHTANCLKEIVNVSKSINKDIATHSNYVSALLKTMSVKSFDYKLYIKKLTTHSYMLNKQLNYDGYIDLIDQIYNRQTQQNQRIPLAFLVRQEMQKRKTFNNKRTN